MDVYITPHEIRIVADVYWDQGNLKTTRSSRNIHVNVFR